MIGAPTPVVGSVPSRPPLLPRAIICPLSPNFMTARFNRGVSFIVKHETSEPKQSRRVIVHPPGTYMLPVTRPQGMRHVTFLVSIFPFPYVPAPFIAPDLVGGGYVHPPQ